MSDFYETLNLNLLASKEHINFEILNRIGKAEKYILLSGNLKTCQTFSVKLGCPILFVKFEILCTTRHKFIGILYVRPTVDDFFVL